MTTATKKSEITATAIYRVTVRETGRECYAVPSDSEPGAYYTTCWNADTNLWECSCKNGLVQAGRGQSANCKHARAAQLSIVVNKARRTEEARQSISYAQSTGQMSDAGRKQMRWAKLCDGDLAGADRIEQGADGMAAVKALGAMALVLGQAATDAMIAQLHEEYERVVVPADRKRQQEQAAKHEAKGTLNGSSQGFSLLK